jgi:hypothetical protein
VAGVVVDATPFPANSCLAVISVPQEHMFATRMPRTRVKAAFPGTENRPLPDLILSSDDTSRDRAQRIASSQRV